MAEYTYEDLKHKTVAELREIASGIEHPDVKGYTQMRKDDIIEMLCKALDIDMHAHHEVVGIDKKSVKKRIKALKEERQKALEDGDSAALKKARRAIHREKRKLRRAMV